MKSLSKSDKQKFLTAHLRHRMTLLRTLRERRQMNESFQGRGDIYRCVKDANLIAVRMLLEFMGLKGVRSSSGATLKANPRKRGPKYADDVKIDQFIGRLLTPSDIPSQFHEVLGGVYCRADKELAHLTVTFDEEYNKEDRLIEAATAVESMLLKHLFRPLGFQGPAMDE